MKNTLILAAACAALTAAETANADNYDPNLDVEIEIGSFFVDSAPNGGEPVVYNFIGADNVVGFSFSGTVTGPSGNSSYASDLLMTIVAGDEDPFLVGGFSTTNDLDWDFQGFQSTEDGDYSSGPHILLRDDPAPAGLEWTISFMNDWNNAAAATLHWSDVVLTVHHAPIPAPGALALLGIAGVCAPRRRR